MKLFEIQTIEDLERLGQTEKVLEQLQAQLQKYPILLADSSSIEASTLICDENYEHLLQLIKIIQSLYLSEIREPLIKKLINTRAMLQKDIERVLKSSHTEKYWNRYFTVLNSAIGNDAKNIIARFCQNQGRCFYCNHSISLAPHTWALDINNVVDKTYHMKHFNELFTHWNFTIICTQCADNKGYQSRSRYLFLLLKDHGFQIKTVRQKDAVLNMYATFFSDLTTVERLDNFKGLPLDTTFDIKLFRSYLNDDCIDLPLNIFTERLSSSILHQVQTHKHTTQHNIESQPLFQGSLFTIIEDESPALKPTEKTNSVKQQIDKKQFTLCSLFSGCGGFDLGFSGGFNLFGREYCKLPFHTVFANDKEKSALQVYKENININSPKDL